MARRQGTDKDSAEQQKLQVTPWQRLIVIIGLVSAEVFAFLNSVVDLSTWARNWMDDVTSEKIQMAKIIYVHE